MARMVQVAGRLCLQTAIQLFLLFFPNVQSIVPVVLDSTVYTPVYVSQYQSYSDVRIFKFEVPPMATDGKWVMVANRTSPDCPIIDVVMTLQSGGYPVISPRNETFPADFFLKRSNLQHVRLKSDGQHVEHVVTSPVPGTWFGAAYALENNNRVIKKLTDGNCRWSIAVNLTVSGWESIQEILTGNSHQPQHFTLVPDQTLSYLRFHVDKRTWGFDVNVTKCVENNVPLLRCPIYVYARSAALPTYGTEENVYVNCSKAQAGKPCKVSMLGPVTDTFQYLKILKGGTNNLTFSISVSLKVCGNDHISFFHNLDRRKRDAHPDDVIIDPQVETNYRDICIKSLQLYRTTEVGSDFITTYALRPSRLQFVENLVFVPSLFTRVFHFEVVPQQDTGGTFRFSMDFNASETPSPGGTIHTNVSACLQRGEMPVSGSLMRCHPDNLMHISSISATTKIRVRRIPYPEEGRWYLALQQNCYFYNTTTQQDEAVPCPKSMVLTKFDMRVTACLDQSCGAYGTCREYFSARYAFSACNCQGGVMGYACDDWSQAASHAIQMLNTLLLTISNLFFIPAIVLSVIRRRFAEAVVYSANMFFSSFYHACDMGPWSVYRTCIMPYSVLQHLDFFCSILSFWVTLIAVSEIHGSLYSVSHMVGAIMLAMAVDWKIHGLLPYLVPIVIGILIVVVSFAVRSYYRKRLYPGKWRLLQMVPGLVLSILGICIFCFIETDVNYPYTHSGWHVCMSLCILFFLPPKPAPTPSSPMFKFQPQTNSPGSDPESQTISSENDSCYAIELDPASNILDTRRSCISSSSEDSILSFHQETSGLVSLIPAQSIGNYGNNDDDDDKDDDELLHDF